MEIRGGCPGHGEPRTGGRWRGEQGAACCLGGTRGAPEGVSRFLRAAGTEPGLSAPPRVRGGPAPPRRVLPPGSAGLQGPQVGRGAPGGRAAGEVRKAEIRAWSAGGREEPRRRGNGTAQGCPLRWSCTAHRVLGGSCGVLGGPRALGTWLSASGALFPRNPHGELRSAAVPLGCGLAVAKRAL